MATIQAYFCAFRPTASMKTVIAGSCAPRLLNSSANFGTTYVIRKITITVTTETSNAG